ncbi:MAG TPA: nuclease-related domain-containing protein [Galbitalea sp.]
MPASSSLRGRVPGQVAMSAIMAGQLGVAPRSRLARLFGKSPLRPKSRPLYRAAVGELLVGDMLDNLGPRWDVLHVVPVDDSGKDIDHLLIGPPGVFAITTENFPGQEIKVNGDFLAVGSQRFDDIAVARELGQSAADLLTTAAGRPIAVTPLLVVVTPTKLAVRQQPEGAHVVASRQLVHYVDRLAPRLDGAEIAMISDFADRESTWRAATGPAQDTQQLAVDFAVLRKEVQDATQTRIFWAVVAFAAVAACIWVSTALIVQHLMGR